MPSLTDLRHLGERTLAKVMLALPARALVTLSGRAQERRDENALDPQVQLLTTMARLLHPKQIHQLSVDEARRELAGSSHILGSNVPRAVTSSDRRIAGPAGEIPIRIYRPKHADSPPALLVYFHGGGWVVGDLESHDDLCRGLCEEAACVVLSVDYRLAPEHRYPAAIDDARAAYAWACENAGELSVDPERIAVGGDSAGGNLAAVVCLDAKENGVPMPKAQLLIYPATDLRRSFPSHRKFAEGYLLTEAMMDWFVGHYVGEGVALDDPRVSPLHARDLEGLPPAIVLTAGYDPLRDEGAAYADRLREAGVSVRYTCHGGLVHGFATMTGALDEARRAMQDAASMLRAALAAAPRLEARPAFG